MGLVGRKQLNKMISKEKKNFVFHCKITLNIFQQFEFRMMSWHITLQFPVH